MLNIQDDEYLLQQYSSHWEIICYLNVICIEIVILIENFFFIPVKFTYLCLFKTIK